MKEQGSELLFVQVREPGEVRKNILETLRGIVEVLKRFEKFRHIRHEKLDRINKLRSQLKEANKLLGNLKSKLPQTSLKAVVVKEEPKHSAKPHRKKAKAKVVVEEKAEKMPRKEMTETDKLEAQLNAIESKLKELI